MTSATNIIRDPSGLQVGLDGLPELFDANLARSHRSARSVA